MSWPTATGVYFIIWWLTLFMVLPFGVRAHSDANEGAAGDGHAPSAPVKPRIVIKALITTAIATVIWLIVYLIFAFELITLSP